jgi:hypothetical protein
MALATSVLVAVLLQNYPSNWRLGPATVVTLISASINGEGLHQELEYALLRVAEVIAGSTVALLQSLAYSLVLKYLTSSQTEKTPEE